jgi:HD-like signal output (HDOD) protein
VVHLGLVQAKALVCPGDASQADTTFTAGLLHGVGKLFHAVNCPQEYTTLVSQAERNDLRYVDLERSLLATTHAELGACVLGTWDLPTEILEVIAFHHNSVAASRKCLWSNDGGLCCQCVRAGTELRGFADRALPY